MDRFKFLCFEYAYSHISLIIKFISFENNTCIELGLENLEKGLFVLFGVMGVSVEVTTVYGGLAVVNGGGIDRSRKTREID